MKYQTVIGIEIHVELNTKSKMFSPSGNSFGNLPNSNVSVIDLAFPGTLPLLNKKAVEYGIRLATALNCQIDDELHFDRKNYFYPDLPKGYQITQDKRPLGKDGYVDIEVDGQPKRIKIVRMHLEEDTAKQLHYENYTLLDYNRCGVPLIEIVTDASIRSGKEAAAYVSKLRQLILYTGISDAKMEEGSMRCDVNISLRPFGQLSFGTKTEIKNLNSISNVEKAIEFEEIRQEMILNNNEKVRQETRRFDENKKETVLMRVKSDATDYRYFTEPNIVPIKLDQMWIKQIQQSLPVMPDVRYKRYTSEFGLSGYDANNIVDKIDLSNYFDECLKHTKEAKLVANWLMGDVSAYLNKNYLDITKFVVEPVYLATLVNMIASNEISSKQAKQIFEYMLVEEDRNPKNIAKKHNMIQISDTSFINGLVTQVLDENPQIVESYKQGKDNVIGFLVGQVLKRSKGQANPGLVNTLLKEELAKR